MKQSSLHETLLYNSLYSFRVGLSKENTKHHLFDNIDGEKEAAAKVKEFTDDDLVPDDKNEKGKGWEY